ncbi:RecQ family ATP-dependent DNA helicase [Thermoactinospora rubra]|uniref:RecQ family ATP-dependent DNA helicase n=1 Tax=Thermoactinospora rubra TaxID=1088767 RepID=UPI000A0FE9E9|nr:RecQ family ATP-dependent DNA helicase [Thermoactinospora rubra]
MRNAIAKARSARAARRALGLKRLRPGQLEAMAALAQGRDTLVVMPTGSGKSAVYQVSALLLPGPTLVVSPLIALQRDQVRALRELDEDAVSVDGSTAARDRSAAFESLRAGETEFLFCSPEQLARPDVVRELAEARPSLMVVDEAHCVSAWGHDFRPDYLRLGEVAEALGRPVIAALTATAAPPVREEIVERLRMRDPLQVVRGFDRPNIALSVRRPTGGPGQAALDIVREQRLPGIVYTSTRRRAEELARVLAEAGLRAAAYHAGVRRSERDRTQARFMAGEIDVVVSTSAFGMGIDKPDVRFVAHAAVPGSLDAYYQEIGRAGRDGEPAEAVLLYRPEDLSLQRFFSGGLPDVEALERVAAAVTGEVDRKTLRERTGLPPRRLTALLDLLERVGAVRLGHRKVSPVAGTDPRAAAEEARTLSERRQAVERTRLEMMRRYAEIDDCRRRFLLAYFGEELKEPCGNCDACRTGSARERVTGGGPFAVHARVEHRLWGPGEVISREQDRVTVLFEAAGYRELLLDAVVEQGLLREASS